MSKAFIARTRVTARITKTMSINAGFAVANKISIAEVFTLGVVPFNHFEFLHVRASCTKHHLLWQDYHGPRLTFL